MPTEFTVGWIGRAHWRKRLDWLFEIASALPQVRFVLAGKELDQTAVALGCAYFSRGDHGIEDLPAVYHGIDCLLITSGTEAGPLTLFEALACGVPVVSTPVGWAPHFAAKAPEIVRLGDSPEALIEGLLQVRQVRRELFDRRAEISALASHPRLDTWFPQVLTLAAAMVAGTMGSRRSAGDGNPPDRTARSR